VSEEKEKTAAELQERERIAQELEQEKKQLEDVTSNLQGNLTVSPGTVIASIISPPCSPWRRSSG